MHTTTPSRTYNTTIACGTNFLKTVKHTLWMLQTVCGCAVDTDDRLDHRLRMDLQFQVCICIICGSKWHQWWKIGPVKSMDHRSQYGRRVTNCGCVNVRSKRSSADVVVWMFATSALTAGPLTREIRRCPAFLSVRKCQTSWCKIVRHRLGVWQRLCIYFKCSCSTFAQRVQYLAPSEQGREFTLTILLNQRREA